MMRSFLVRFENSNSGIFGSRLISGEDGVNQPTFREHINHMLRPMAYGTHVELEATATYYQAPIYICRRNRLQEGYHWEVIKPLCKPENLRFPLFMRTDRHIPLQCVGYLILNFFLMETTMTA